MLVKLLDSNMKEIEKEIDWNDENIFEFRDICQSWKIGRLLHYNANAGYKYLFDNGLRYECCKEINRIKQISELGDINTLWVRNPNIKQKMFKLNGLDICSQELKVGTFWLSMRYLANEKWDYSHDPINGKPIWKSFKKGSE